MIITKKEADFIRGKECGQHFFLQLDFGRRKIGVIKQENKAIFDGGLVLDLELSIKKNFCYLLDSQGLRKIIFFSEDTNRSYKLVPTPDWPTISISSVPMHRLSSPKKDSQAKISLIKPQGIVLDTCMGLGYTAILAAREAGKIITFEKDETVFAVAKLNPLSRELFLTENIEIRRKDVILGIKELKNSYFDWTWKNINR